MDKIKKIVQGLARNLGKINKLSLPATIVIVSLIIGGFYFGSQVIKQHSIERQQEIKLQEARRIEGVKAEQEHKEYVAKRKMECYEIYEKERDKWNNVESNFYNKEKDVCVVRYENPDWKEGDPNSCELFEGLFDDKESTCTIHKYFTKEY
jgi:hypothetical protein